MLIFLLSHTHKKMFSGGEGGVRCSATETDMRCFKWGNRSVSERLVTSSFPEVLPLLCSLIEHLLRFYQNRIINEIISQKVKCDIWKDLLWYKAWGAVDGDRTVEEKGKAFKRWYQTSGFIELTIQTYFKDYLISQDVSETVLSLRYAPEQTYTEYKY